MLKIVVLISISKWKMIVDFEIFICLLNEGRHYVALIETWKSFVNKVVDEKKLDSAFTVSADKAYTKKETASSSMELDLKTQKCTISLLHFLLVSDDLRFN